MAQQQERSYSIVVFGATGELLANGCIGLAANGCMSRQIDSSPRFATLGMISSPNTTNCPCAAAGFTGKRVLAELLKIDADKQLG